MLAASASGIDTTSCVWNVEVQSGVRDWSLWSEIWTAVELSGIVMSFSTLAIGAGVVGKARAWCHILRVANIWLTFAKVWLSSTMRTDHLAIIPLTPLPELLYTHQLSLHPHPLYIYIYTYTALYTCIMVPPLPVRTVENIMLNLRVGQTAKEAARSNNVHPQYIRKMRRNERVWGTPWAPKIAIQGRRSVFDKKMDEVRFLAFKSLY